MRRNDLMRLWGGLFRIGEFGKNFVWLVLLIIKKNKFYANFRLFLKQ